MSVAFLFLAFFMLVDEYVKESYIFDPRDLLAPFPTHEQLFIVFLVIGLVLGLRRWA